MRHIKKIEEVFLATPKGYLTEILLGGFCLQLLALSVPVFVHVIFDKVIVHSSYNTLHVVAVGMVLAALFEGVLLYFFSRHVHYLFEHLAMEMGRPTLRHLLRLPLRYFDTHPKGEIARCMRDVNDIRNFVSAASVTTLTDVIFIAAILVLMAFYSLPLALTVAVCIPILVSFSFLMGPGITKANKSQLQLHNRFEALFTEGLNNMQTIKTHALELRWQEKWVAAYERVVQAVVKLKLSASFESSLTRMLQRILMLVVLWVGAAQVLSNELSYGQLIVCYMLALIVLATCAKIFEIWGRFKAVQEARKSLDAMLNIEEEPFDQASAGACPGTGPLELKNVFYRYSSDAAHVLTDINARIERRMFVGLVGESGSGKSTLAKLLQRHYTPSEGSISLGLVDLRSIELGALRQHVLLVMQDAAVFQDTIASNLRYGAPQASLEDIAQAARLACADEFIRRLPKGYDTVLDERGAGLSSGQRQRIALARAIVQKPGILILDEATNALDTHTERTVLENLRREFADRILIVITHRPHTLQDADQILFIQQGQATRFVPPYPAALFSTTPAAHAAAQGAGAAA